MSSVPNSSSSLPGSTSNPPDGGSSGRTFASSFTGIFGSLIPSYDSDGHINGVYDPDGHLHVFDATRRTKISVPGLGASPTLVTASSQPPSTMQTMAGGGSVSRASSSMKNSNYTPPFQFGDVPQGFGVSHMNQLNQESISQNEDFAALPGYTGSNADYQMDSHHQELMMQCQQSSMGSHGGYNFGGASTSHYPQPQQHAQAVSSSAISSQTGVPQSIGSTSSVNAVLGYDQPLPFLLNTSQYRGETLSAIGQPIKPAQATTQPNPDPFGMLGLLSVLKNTNPDATALALGIDLTAMGLDMTSKETLLFKTFASPWANEPLKDDHNEFTIPQCYNAMQLPPLDQRIYGNFELETLFYIFYSMPRDKAQLFAADELNNRGWFFYKLYQRWFVRIGEPQVQTYAYERGTYDCFDQDKFEAFRTENMVICYEMLEGRPSLPPHRV